MYIAEDAQERRPVICRIGRRHIARLNALATRARDQVGASAGRVPREALLRALLLTGLDLAIQQGKRPENQDHRGMQLRCEVTMDELYRLSNYHDSAGLFKNGLEQSRECCNGALALLALLSVETEESFFTATFVPLLLVTKAQP